MNSSPFSIVALVLISGLGLVSLSFLFLQAKDWWDRRADRGPVEPPPRPPPRPATQKLDEGQVSEQASGDRKRLQRLLNKGVTLEKNAPKVVALANPLMLATRLEDVEAWEAEVEAALEGRLRDIGLFYYEPPRSPLTALTVSPLENPLKQRLQQRLKQLETIVKRTP